MKKFFSVMILAVIFFCGQKIYAADIWLYTDSGGAQYYLRDYNLPARSWCFAHVVKVSGNNVTNLAYRFENGFDHYSVCEGSEAYAFMSRESHPIIEEGKISENVIASKIWKDYLGPLDAERWARIKANESRR